MVKLSSSKSSSEANTTTQNYDQRVVGGNNSTNVSASSSTVNVLDAGAITKSYAFAKDTLDSSMHAVDAALSNVQQAYSTAKAGEQRVLVAAGLVVVGIVAVTALKGKA